MKTAETKKKKFATADQIFASYIPNYPSSKNSKKKFQKSDGARIVEKLLTKFEDSIKPKK